MQMKSYSSTNDFVLRQLHSIKCSETPKTIKRKKIHLIASGSFLSQIQMVHTSLPLKNTQIIKSVLIVHVLNIGINIKYIKYKEAVQYKHTMPQWTS